MFETVSVFDAMEIDNTEHRVAARRALALAHHRVESNLGRFLRAAQTEEEFFERLALVQEDFGAYVASASEEVGHDHPEHIAAALKDHYRLATDKVEFVETPEEEQEKAEEKAEEEKTAKRTWSNVTYGGVNMMGTMPFNTEQAMQAIQQHQQQHPRPGGTPSVPGAPGAPAPGAPSAQNVLQTEGVGPAASHPQTQNPQADPRQQIEQKIEQNPTLMNVMGGKQGSPLAHSADYRVMDPAGDDPQSATVTEGGAFEQGFGGHLGTCPDCGGQIEENPDPKRTYHPDSFPPYACHNCRKTFTPLELEMANRGTYPKRGRVADRYPEQMGHKVVYDEMGYPSDVRPNGPKQFPWEEVPGEPNEAESPHGTQYIDPLREFPPVPGGNPRGVGQHDLDQSQVPPSKEDYLNYIMQEPGRIGSNEHDLVTCPECGGSGDATGAHKCGKCHGQGKVPNFGDSMVDNVGADIKTAADGNTDLGGPEPKMDKRKWTPSDPGKPDYEDGDRHPTKEKDVTEVIGPMQNDHDLEEIHGKGEFHKDKKLPTQKGDEPFADGGVNKGPHTDTWGDKGQTGPVTPEALEDKQSKADDIHKNPLTELLQNEWPSDQMVQSAFKSSN